MSSAVLPMPVMPTLAYPVSDHKRREVQQQLDTVYDELFANLKQQYRILDERRVFTFFTPAPPFDLSATRRPPRC